MTKSMNMELRNMTDDIVTRLQNLADKYKNNEDDREMLYADYETICDAWADIEHLRMELYRISTSKSREK